jgi:hypothetical protein
MLQNSTTKGFSYAIIAKEVRKRRHEIALKTVWKVLKQTVCFQCKLILKPTKQVQQKAAIKLVFKARELNIRRLKERDLYRQNYSVIKRHKRQETCIKTA